ncbi:ROK family transcriptional regulator [Microbacterium oxydans]|uniref:ROK family transcriptional regulator n=1 Tax=Microbacterium oxydans TaxID=82380 RepID=UPI00226B6EAD|nr:ROK family transcriptional regulator [Microbacterium oxydans]WAA66833.1 ROK family protein [Microbacterium oxydans]
MTQTPTSVEEEPQTSTVPGEFREAPAVTTVFADLLKHGPVARVTVAQRTGLSQAAVTKAVNRLDLRGLISTHDAAPSSTPGRPVQPISVIEDAQVTIGVTVRVDEIFAVATTIRANVLHSIHRPLASIAVDDVVEAIAEVVDALVDALGPTADRIVGVGVAVSGDVDKEHGIVRDSPRLNWSQVQLRSLLGSRIPFPIVIENDVRALAIAEEWFGIGVDSHSFAIVTIGVGIGCGLYVNGDVVEGALGVSGELGHLPLATTGERCTCGRRGCVETVASSAAILARIRSAKNAPFLSMQDAVELGRAGDDDAVAAFEAAGSMIGLAIATMANLVGPSVVLVAGESVTNYDLFEQHLRAAFEQHAFGAVRDCRIITRTHTFEDWARGAAASVVHSMLHQTLTS